MKRVHTKNKKSRRPFTGVKPNKFYNWFSSEVNLGNMKKENKFFPPYAKLPKPTYKN